MTRVLAVVNQKGGVDCQSCAWPDPEHRTINEYCENGAKAFADEAMTEIRRLPENDRLKEADELQIAFRAEIFLAVLGLQEKLLRRLDGTHDRRASHGVTIDADAEVDLSRAIVGLEGLDECKQAVGWPAVQLVKHKSTSFS